MVGLGCMGLADPDAGSHPWAVGREQSRENIRQAGASSTWAWQFSKALHLQRENGCARYVTTQDHYNLLYREEEREMLPLCEAEGIGSLPWSPLARGRLTRPWDVAALEEPYRPHPVAGHA